MPEPAIRKHVTNVCSYKLFLLSEVFGSSFELRTIRLFLFQTLHTNVYTHIYTYTCIYIHTHIYVHIYVHVCAL